MKILYRKRNRAKRIIRECYTKLEDKLIEGNSIVILMNKNFYIDDIKFPEVYDEMLKVFQKAKILKKEDEIWKKYLYI